MTCQSTRLRITTLPTIRQSSTLTITSSGATDGHTGLRQPSHSYQKAVTTLPNSCHLLPITTRTARTLRQSLLVLSVPDLEQATTTTGSRLRQHMLAAITVPPIHPSLATSLLRLINGILSTLLRLLLLPSTSLRHHAQNSRIVHLTRSCSTPDSRC
jgi:hypothetical protein